MHLRSSIHSVQRAPVAVLASALILFAFGDGKGALISVSSVNSGDWQDGFNWSNGLVPKDTFNTEHQVTLAHNMTLDSGTTIGNSRLAIQPGASFTIDLDSSFAYRAADGLFLPGSIQNENVINEGTFQINLGGVDVNVEAGIFTPPHFLNGRPGGSPGVINLNAATNHPTAPNFPGYAVLAFEGPFLNRTGSTITMSDQPIPNGIQGGNSLFAERTFLGVNPTLTNDGTIMGAGQIRPLSAALMVINTSTGIISTSTNNPLILGGVYDNQGLMQATGPGGFIFNGIVQSTGTIQITNSRLELALGAQLSTPGSDVDFAGTSELKLNGNTGSAFNINNTGNLTIVDDPTVTGDITNQNGATLTFNDPFNLVGTVTNNGNVVLEPSTDLTVTAGNFDVDASVELKPASTIVMGAGDDYNQTAGTTTLNNATLDASGLGSLINVSGGSIKGTGILKGNVNVSGAGMLDPGLSFGQINIQGNLGVSDNAIIHMELGEMGMPPLPTGDFLLVTGQTLFGSGEIQIEFVNGFLPPPGSVFQFFDFQGGVSGTPGNVSVIGGPLNGALDPSTGQITFTAIPVPAAIEMGLPLFLSLVVSHHFRRRFSRRERA